MLHYYLQFYKGRSLSAYLTYSTKSIGSLFQTETESKSIQPIGKAAIYDVDSIFNHNIDFVFLGN